MRTFFSCSAPFDKDDQSYWGGARFHNQARAPGSFIKEGAGVVQSQWFRCVLLVTAAVWLSFTVHTSEASAKPRRGRLLDRSRSAGLITGNESPYGSTLAERLSNEPIRHQVVDTTAEQKWFGKEVRSVGSRLATNLKERTTDLKETLTPKPKVIKADDPTSLAAVSPPLSADVCIASAQLHQFSGNYEKAAEFYRKVLDSESGNLDALIGFGRMLDRQAKYAEATTYYQQATQSHPANASAHNDLGLCYARQGQLAQSIEALQTAIQIQPESKLYRNNIATVLVEGNRLDDAYRYLVDAHGEAAANYNVGFLLNQRGDKATARQFFKRAVLSDPQFQQAQAMLASLDGAEVKETAVAWPETSQESIPATASVGQTAKRAEFHYASSATPPTPQPATHTPSVEGTSLAAQQASYSGIQWPNRTARFPQSGSGAVAPMPQGEAFLYSNSLIEHLPPTR